MLDSILYSTLTRFGDYYPLDLNFGTKDIISCLGHYDWVKYNPRRNINREGLSITSLDGGMSGKPDLDSLYQYMVETGQELDEDDFTTKTEIYKYFQKWLDPIEKHLGRTHIIRLNEGGYFPPHRDNVHSKISSFRLLIPINYNSSHNFFMLEDRKIEFENGKMYFINTSKTHAVFNADPTPFYFVVCNVILSEDSVNDVLKYLPNQ